MNNYFNSITDKYGYLTKSPKKSAALNNAAISGNVSVLENSYNRALVIYTEKAVYLQSYDTIVLEVKNNRICKLWYGYSVTTLKHVNEFLSRYGKQLNKKQWLDLESMEV